jgi:DNA-binding NtrC family response regulator
MNLSNPVLICNENEEFRILIRDILTKNGFFHIMEASSVTEARSHLEEKRNFFVLLDSKLFTRDMFDLLKKQKDYLVFVNNLEPETLRITSKIGLNRILSYPIYSRKIMNKIGLVV